MTTRSCDCQEAVRHASRYLDGRLSPATRRWIQAHVRGCASCSKAFRDFGRLSRATHNLLPRRAASDLAHSVRCERTRRRTTLLARLGRRRSRLAVAAGVVALAGVVWWTGFAMGRSTANEPAPIAIDEGPAVRADTPGDSRQTDERFVAAARGVLQDLALVDRLAPRARQPLLAARLCYFDLDTRAQRVLAADPPVAPDVRALAGFVRDLAAAIDRGVAPDWDRWRRDAWTRGLYAIEDASAGPAYGERAADVAQLVSRRRAVAERVGVDLSTRDRDALAGLLELEDAVSRGDVAAPIRFATRLNGRPADADHDDPFALPASFTTARALARAGLRAAARPVVEDLAAHFPSFTATAVHTESSVQVSGGVSSASLQTSVSVDASGPGAAAMVRRMLDELEAEPR